ncbi:MAG: hypothetical protein LAN59_13200 [Acidobacteriia bacterium]|nr:hypothetical protein [Terriglobia bacterium]
MECQNPRCRRRKFLRRFLRPGESESVVLQGRWYCSLECFEQAITDVFARLIKLPDEPLPRTHRVPLGLLLLGRGLITDAQLKSALRAQRESGTDRLGRWLVRLGIASAQDVSAALAAQWGCALFPLERDRRYRECGGMIPLALLESSRMIPVHYVASSQSLFLAFSEDIDRTALYSIEQLVGARTEVCVATEAALDHALEDLRAMSRPSEVVFDRIWDPGEMARAVRGYALKLGADELLLARPRKFLWIRMRSSGRAWDLLFRSPAGRAA